MEHLIPHITWRIYLFVLGKQPSVNQLMYYRTLSTMSKLADFVVHEYMQLLKEGEDWNVRPLGLLSAHTKWSQAFSYLGEFLFFIFFFRFIKNICRIFFLKKCHPAANSTGGMKVPPDEPATGALQKAYRRFIRRKGYCSDPRGYCSDLPSNETAVL